MAGLFFVCERDIAIVVAAAALKERQLRVDQGFHPRSLCSNEREVWGPASIRDCLRYHASTPGLMTRTNESSAEPYPPVCDKSEGHVAQAEEVISAAQEARPDGLRVPDALLAVEMARRQQRRPAS